MPKIPQSLIRYSKPKTSSNIRFIKDFYRISTSESSQGLFLTPKTLLKLFRSKSLKTFFSLKVQKISSRYARFLLPHLKRASKSIGDFSFNHTSFQGPINTHRRFLTQSLKAFRNLKTLTICNPLFSNIKYCKKLKRLNILTTTNLANFERLSRELSFLPYLEKLQLYLSTSEEGLQTITVLHKGLRSRDCQIVGDFFGSLFKETKAKENKTEICSSTAALSRLSSAFSKLVNSKQPFWLLENADKAENLKRLSLLALSGTDKRVFTKFGLFKNLKYLQIVLSLTLAEYKDFFKYCTFPDGLETLGIDFGSLVIEEAIKKKGKGMTEGQDNVKQLESHDIFKDFAMRLAKLSHLKDLKITLNQNPTDPDSQFQFLCLFFREKPNLQRLTILLSPAKVVKDTLMRKKSADVQTQKEKQIVTLGDLFRELHPAKLSLKTLNIQYPSLNIQSPKEVQIFERIENLSLSLDDCSWSLQEANLLNTISMNPAIKRVKINGTIIMTAGEMTNLFEQLSKLEKLQELSLTLEVNEVTTEAFLNVGKIISNMNRLNVLDLKFQNYIQGVKTILELKEVLSIRAYKLSKFNFSFKNRIIKLDADNKICIDKHQAVGMFDVGGSINDRVSFELVN